MDVRLPDGTIIQNVPDGTTKADLVAKLQRNGMNVPGEWLGEKPLPSAAESAGGAPAPKGTGSAAVDAGNAVGTGYFRGLTRLVGAPVDLAASAVDLVKHGASAAYTAATGKEPPAALKVLPRSDVVGSGDWLLNQVRKTAPGRLMVDPANPEYEGGYLQNAGGALTSVMNPQSAGQAVHQALIGQASAGLGKGAYDLTGSESAAIVAGALPGAASVAVPELTKRAIRGGEEGRKATAQRVQDLKNAGVDAPTVGLATGNKMVGGTENLLQNTPGAMGIMGKARENAIAGLQRTTQRAADTAAPVRGADVAGQAIQTDLKNALPERFKAGQQRVYGALDSLIPGNQPIVVSNTERALTDLTQTIPGASETSQGFINGRINRIKQGFDVDTGTVSAVPRTSYTTPGRSVSPDAEPFTGVGVPAAEPAQVVTVPGGRMVMVPPSSYTTEPSPFSGLGVGDKGKTVTVPGRMFTEKSRTYGTFAPFAGVGGAQTEIPQQIALPPSSGTVAAAPRRASPFAGVGGEYEMLPPTMPYEAVRKLRTNVGTELSNASLAPDVPTGQWKQLYAGLSQDMGDAAAATGPAADAAWKRANAYNRAGIARMERVAPFANTAAPEQAFTGLVGTARENNTTLQAVKKSVSEDTRAKVAGTVIDRLGRATPGNQNDLSDAWSQERFLTNWNTMTPKARNELFSGFKDADKVRSEVEAVAKATSMMRDSSKLWANPSGTGANAFARGLLFGAPVAGLVEPTAALAIGGGLLGANGAARALTSQRSVDALMRRTTLDPAILRAQANALLSSGLLSQQQ